MDFNFDRANPVIEAFGCGSYKDHKWEALQIRFVGNTPKETVIDVDAISFIVDETVANHTGSPCFDAKSNIMAFPDEMKREFYLRHWNVNQTTH